MQVEEGAAAYADFAAGDFSVALSQQHEVRRLTKLQNEALTSAKEAQALYDETRCAEGEPPHHTIHAAYMMHAYAYNAARLI